jgi:hypothetical protein
MNHALIETNNGDGLRAVSSSVPGIPESLPDLCHHALYEIYVNGQYRESVGNLGENAQRALKFYRLKQEKQAVEVRVQPCRLPGCTWRAS